MTETMVRPMFMNDWPLRRLAVTVVSWEIALFGFFVMGLIGVGLPQLMAPLALAFFLGVPGSLILRSLRFRNLGGVETITFSVGLSVLSVMGLGLVANLVGPALGVNRPIAQFPLLVTMALFASVMLLVCYLRDEDTEFKPLNRRKPNGWPLLFGVSLVLVSVTGALAVNNLNSGAVTIVFFCVLCAVPLLVIMNRLPHQAHTVVLFCVSLALLYQRSLVSYQVAGWDSQVEFYFSSLTVSNGAWSPSILSNVNSVLPSTILVPALSLTTGIEITWIYKAVIPLVYSLVPVGLYRVFATQLSRKTAFLSVFLIISTFIFFQVMIDLPRQQIAELFLTLILVILTDRKIAATSSRWLVVLFAVGLVVSHYGLSYVFLFMVVVAAIYLRLSGGEHEVAKSPLTIGFGVFYAVCAISWYMYVAGGSVLNDVVGLGSRILASFTSDLFSEPTQPVGTLTGPQAPLHAFTKVLYIILSGLIVIGFIRRRHEPGTHRLHESFTGLAVGALALLVLITVVPFLASALNFNRFYGITLLFLAPFSFFGTHSVLRFVGRGKPKMNPDRVFAVFLVGFLIFNSGVMYEMTNEPPLSMSLDAQVDYPRFTGAEVAAAQWFAASYQRNQPLYADGYRSLLLIGRLGFQADSLAPVTILQPGIDYIYLGRWNLLNDEIVVYENLPTGPIPVYIRVNATNLVVLSLSMNAIYDSGDARILESYSP